MKLIEDIQMAKELLPTVAMIDVIAGNSLFKIIWHQVQIICRIIFGREAGER